jgi:hypothetical protein
MNILSIIFFLGFIKYNNAMPTELSANFLYTNPVIDGIISVDEYGYSSPYFVDFSVSGFYWDGGIKRLNTSNTDHSCFMYFGYTNTSLNIAFNISDNFIDSNVSDAANCFQNDGVEIFINSDSVNNDFGYSGSREGFQLVVDAAGNKLTNTVNKLDFNNTMWNAAASITSFGYIIEVDIPLFLIDTLDGPGENPPAINSTILINIAFNDNDRDISGQDSQGALWLNPLRQSLYTVKEPGWSLVLTFLTPIPTIPTTTTAVTTPTTTTPTTKTTTTTTTSITIDKTIQNNNITKDSSSTISNSSNSVYIYAPIVSIVGVLLIVFIIIFYRKNKNKNTSNRTIVNKISFIQAEHKHIDNSQYDINTLVKTKEEQHYKVVVESTYDDLYNSNTTHYDLAKEQSSDAKYELATENLDRGGYQEHIINEGIYGFINNDVKGYLDVEH